MKSTEHARKLYEVESQATASSGGFSFRQPRSDADRQSVVKGDPAATDSVRTFGIGRAQGRRVSRSADASRLQSPSFRDSRADPRGSTALTARLVEVKSSQFSDGRS